ncbi:hypothetical protein DMA10_04875 [Streptomyces sp. WAC 01420]|nr:hypothetical protein DLM49_23845 [Streptomyces sp. WAC 01438]RSN00081.1 hypothetical protein DMA10_04875 [Streptomyces sp. WAC 01420]
MFMRRANRLVNTGCLSALVVLTVVLGIVASWLWYRHWHDEKVNSERKEKSLASILEQAEATAHETARALDTGGAADADALTGVIWQHSRAPVITYSPSRREFTAMVAKSAQYDRDVVLPGGGAVQVTRCFVFIYTQHPGGTWASKVSERSDDVCRPSTRIGNRVRLALTRFANLNDEDLTGAGVQNALDPTGRRFIDVKNVARAGDMVTASVLVSSTERAVGQCYRLTRPVADGDQRAVAAVPALSC